ncbi:tetratricopeptide repeat protein [Flavitalea sp.]|nr:tetratricopeptide repeat protein [Flavitalea sp.]
MKYSILVTGLLLIISGNLNAQQPDSTSPEGKAKIFLRQGDYTNAIMLLNRASASNPNDLEIQKDLAYAYYMKRDFVKGLELAKPIVKRKDADVQSFQILGMMFKAIEERKECEKMYKEGLRRFPNSGVLYNEYGEMLWTKQEFANAVKQWERGILSEPSYPGNYYNAAKFYYFSADKVWGILYGEVFINLESYSQRTTEIQTQLIDGYKKLFTDPDIMKNQQHRSDFANAVLENMKKNAGLVAGGISVESLNKLRKAFIADWFQKDATRFPYRLFAHQQQLIKAGMFDAYNQWVFSAANATQYQQWAANHIEEVNNFTNFQKNRVFKLPKGQYYQKIN